MLILVYFKAKNNDNSYFYKNSGLSFPRVPYYVKFTRTVSLTALGKRFLAKHLIYPHILHVTLKTDNCLFGHGRTLENLCTRKAQSSRGGHSRRVEKICTLLLKKVINFLIFHF